MGLIFKIFTPKTTQKEFFMKHSPKTLLILLIGGTLALTSCASSKLCGSSEFDKSRQFCYVDNVYNVCGGPKGVYDPQSQTCSDGSIVPKCGADLYDPSTHFCKSGTTPTAYSTFTDSRDSKTYKYVTIGTLAWMAENLNYKPSEGYSVCYRKEDSNCEKYGLLYDYNTAMNACPQGWRLPSDKEWETLINYAGKEEAGIKLKKNIEWGIEPSSIVFKDGKYKGTNNGTDDYGFSAMPGGEMLDPQAFASKEMGKQAATAALKGSAAVKEPNVLDAFESIGFSAKWWGSTIVSSPLASGPYTYTILPSKSFNTTSNKDAGLSVRCVANASQVQQQQAPQEQPQAQEQPQQEQAQEPQPEPHKEQHQEE
jgi:uncharacterized protein (TIGR02145 family)